MLGRLRFAFSYAIRNMIRDRRRTIFTLLCVAAGVATVVALRALGLMITDALTSNVQAFLRGDVRVVASNTSGFTVTAFEEGDDRRPIGAQQVAAIDAWAEERGINVTYMLNTELMQTAVITGTSADGEALAGPPALTLSLIIEPAEYPYYDIIRAEAPAGVLLADLFSEPHSVVLSRRLADQIEAQVGDQVRIGAAEAFFTVTGIVPDVVEGTFDNPQSLLFPFAYLNRAEQGQFGLPPLAADRAYLQLPEGANLDLTLRETTLWPPPERGRWRFMNTVEVLEENQQLADILSRFVLVLSLVGLVIGGVGIINTMIVAVNRRSLEIAVLKTLGLQGSDVSLIFMAEACLSGVLGSAIGIGLGIVLSYLARDMGQQAFGVPMPWRVYFDPVVIGLALGLTATIFFSFLPTSMATRIRPNLVLRAGSIPMARAGCLWTVLSMLLLIIGFGLLVDLIIGTNRFDFLQVPPPLTPGIISTFAVFLLILIFLAVTWIVVWLLGKLPSFRNANLQIAFRGLTTNRSRTALSLMALIVGMSALSGTLIMTRSINILLTTSITQPLGGNVIVLPIPLLQGVVRARLDSLEGVNGYREVRFPGNVELEAIDGDRRYERWFADADEDPQADLRRARLEMVLGMNIYGEPARGELVEGRYLTPDDDGEPLIMIPYLPELEAHGVGVGSSFELRLGRTTQTFEVVGVIAPDPNAGFIPFSLGDFALQVPADALGSNSAVPFDLIVVDAEPEHVRDVLATVGAVPGVFVFDVSIFDSIISRLLNQMAALPLLVAGLSLFAATALIATTVALATLERRRQIAMLKAIGVSRWQALGQLLIENGAVGVIGGLISLVPTLLVLGLVPALTEGLVSLPVPNDLLALMLVLAVVITLGATLVTAWGASAEAPLNALRDP
ncbi:MAG: ABC transporter permease [Anaerolineae bacterium]|nr:ABC transporter permease [Anaerolineae bacterium]